MIAFGRTDQGIVRKDNQDYFQIEELKDDKLLIAVVCDGMGGAQAGNVASKQATETFIQSLSGQPGALLDDELVSDAMCDAMQAANRVIYEMAKTEPGYRGMGTTLVGAVLQHKKDDWKARIINVGDSRAYHIGKDGMMQLTKDHSLVEDMITRGDITRAEAQHHPSRNLITRVVGTDLKLACDRFTADLKPGDRLLLCTDGLTNLVSDEELFEEIRHFTDLEKCCEMLITLALSRGGSDNVTVLMVGV
ncbi:MAG: Stp1/IreP family PP2C-type Ser/Thr phosphatase [Oscillospiraceae bacterium]|nr:Stp1/IreP family PP2C-type Ser/Thr phosphatase [Oscillospiraceae bacterium]